MIKWYVLRLRRKNPLYIFARLIELVEGIDWSHCEIAYVENDDFENAICYGSTFPKSRKTTMKELKEQYEVKLAIPLIVKVDSPDAVCNALMGKTYSFGQILLTGFKIILKGSVSWLPYVKPNLSKFLICTEFCGLFMQEACGYRFEQSPELLTLQEVEEIALKNFIKDE